MIITWIQIFVGAMFYSSLPRELVVKISDSKECGGVFEVTMLTMIVSLGAALRCSVTGGRTSLTTCLVSALATVLGMLVWRQQISGIAMSPDSVRLALSPIDLYVLCGFVLLVSLVVNVYWLGQIAHRLIRMIDTAQTHKEFVNDMISTDETIVANS
jgi:uncharacterized membrane-anchored protein